MTGGLILCPVDYSEQSRQALLRASVIAEYRGSDVTVLSVVEPLLAQAARIRFGIDLARTEEEPLREFVEATLPERVASQVRMELAVGKPADVILQTARWLRAGLIVMGTHGRGGVGKILLGSTTEQVLRRTEWPILAVPGGAPAVEHPVHLKTILLATDFREGAMAATPWADDLASDLGVPLVLTHVVEPVIMPPRWQTLAADFESDRVGSGKQMLGKLAASLRDTRIDCVVSVGRPADTIASLAGERGAGLVVMGLANPEDSEPGSNPGSIAYRVLRIAHVPVVVVPALRRTSNATSQLSSVPRQLVEHLARE